MAASCVVCQLPAAVYCSNDKAHLCDACDVKIHSSNAVAGRHHRMRICQNCVQAPSVVYCHNDAVHLCTACDSEIHSNNPLAASHDVVPSTPLACPEMACCAKVVQPAVPCESVAGSADCGMEFADFSSTFLSQPEALKAASPTGSEAVVPVMPLEQDMSMDAALAVPSFKDLKDFDDFKALGDVDPAWLDMGFDFSDILSDDAGRVPIFQGEELDEVATVPAFEMPAAEPPAPAAPVPGRKRSAPSAAAEQRAAKVTAPSAVAPSAAYAAMQSYAAYASFAAGYGSSAQQTSAAASMALAMSGANLTREQRVARYREKRKNRKFEKTIRYASRKAYAEIRPRIKGRFARKEEIEAWKAAHGGEDAVVPEVLDEC